MKLVVFISFLLMLSLCSSGLEEGHKVAENNLYSSNKVEDPAPPSPAMFLDYPGSHPNPRDDPAPPSPSNAEEPAPPSPSPSNAEEPAPPSPSQNYVN